MVEDVTEALSARGYIADRIHGDIAQNNRERVIQKFRDGSVELLVATDVAARGLDIDDIDLVFNYDLPYDPEDYVHRIGRTGRAGRSGKSITFVYGRDIYRLEAIERYTRQAVRRMRIPSSKKWRAGKQTTSSTPCASASKRATTSATTTGSSAYSTRATRQRISLARSSSSPAATTAPKARRSPRTASPSAKSARSRKRQRQEGQIQALRWAAGLRPETGQASLQAEAPPCWVKAEKTEERGFEWTQRAKDLSAASKCPRAVIEEIQR